MLVKKQNHHQGTYKKNQHEFFQTLVKYYVLEIRVSYEFYAKLLLRYQVLYRTLKIT